MFYKYYVYPLITCIFIVTFYLGFMISAKLSYADNSESTIHFLKNSRKISKNCIFHFNKWKKLSGFSAFAVSQGGACGYNSNFDNLYDAGVSAVKFCKKHTNKRRDKRSCKVIAVKKRVATGERLNTGYNSARVGQKGNPVRFLKNSRRIPSHCMTNFNRWKEQPGFSAFAVSRAGACGSNWRFGNLYSAGVSAVKVCRKAANRRRDQASCRVVAVKEPATLRQIESDDLSADQRNKVKLVLPNWHLPKNCQKTLKEWLKLNSFGAFAASRNGACGSSKDYSNQPEADRSALRYCQKYDGNKYHYKNSCKVIAQLKADEKKKLDALFQSSLLEGVKYVNSGKIVKGRERLKKAITIYQNSSEKYKVWYEQFGYIDNFKALKIVGFNKFLKNLTLHQIKNYNLKQGSTQHGGYGFYDLDENVEILGNNDIRNFFYNKILLREEFKNIGDILGYLSSYHFDLRSFKRSNIYLLRGIKENSFSNEQRFYAYFSLAQNYFELGENTKTSQYYWKFMLKYKHNEYVVSEYYRDEFNKLTQKLLEENSDEGDFYQKVFFDMEESLEKECNDKQKWKFISKISAHTIFNDVLFQWPQLSSLILKSPIIEKYFECVIKSNKLKDKTVDRDDLETSFYQTIFHLYAGTNKRDKANDLLQFILDNYPEWEEPIFESFKGLILGGKMEWLDPFMLIVSAKYSNKYIDTINSDDFSSMALIGVIYEKLGYAKKSKKIFLRITKERKDFSYDIDISKFLSYVELRYGDKNKSEKYLKNIGSEFLINWSGAAASPDELLRVRQMALRQAKIHELQQNYLVAREFYFLASFVPDVFMADPAKAEEIRIKHIFDDTLSILSTEGLTRVYLKLGQLNKIKKITTTVLKKIQERFRIGFSIENNEILRWSKKMRPLMKMHLHVLGQKQDLSDPEVLIDSFFVGQFLKVTGTGATLGKLATRLKTNDPQHIIIIRKIQDLNENLDALHFKLMITPNGKADKIIIDINKIEEKIRRIRDENKDLDISNISRLSLLTIKSVQNSLKQDEVLVNVFSAKDYTYLWWVSSSQSVFKKINMNKEQLDYEVEKIRRSLLPQNGSSYEKFSFVSSYKIFKSLFGSFKTVLGHNIRHLIFVPHGALESLPLSLLITEKQSVGLKLENYRIKKLPWLIRKVAISNLPSVVSLDILRNNHKTVLAKLPFLGIGNPVLKGKPGGLRGINIAQVMNFRGAVKLKDISELPSLPHTGLELKTFSRILGSKKGSSLLLQEMANEAVVKAFDLSRYRIISFATHGVIAGELEGLTEPALILTPPKTETTSNDGLLTATEITKLNLNAELVILSACNTASGNGKPGAEGLSGLSKAFFYAGARSLLVSNWSVPSQATVRLTTGMISKVKKQNLSYARALQASMIHLMDKVGTVRNAHPTFWAPFIIVGVQ